MIQPLLSISRILITRVSQRALLAMQLRETQSQPIRRAQNPTASSIQNMGINHCGADIFVPQEFLNRPDIVTVLQQVRRKRVTKRVAPRRLRYPGAPDSLLDRPLQDGFVKVMSASHPPPRVSAEPRSGENILPTPLSWGVGVFSIQRVRQRGPSVFVLQVLLVLPLDLLQVVPQWLPCGCRQHGHDPVRNMQVAEDRPDLFPRQYHRQPPGSSGPDDSLYVAHFFEQDLVIQKQKSIKRLILSGSADAAVGSQTGEEAGNLRLAHLRWVALVMEEDKPLDPADVGFLCFIAVLPGTDGLSDLVEEPGFWCA